MLSAFLIEDMEERKRIARRRVFPRHRFAPKEIVCGIGVREIARLTGMEPTRISSIFSGKRNTTLATAVRIAEALTKRLSRYVTAQDIADLIKMQPWNQPLTVSDAIWIADKEEKRLQDEEDKRLCLPPGLLTEKPA